LLRLVLLGYFGRCLWSNPSVHVTSVWLSAIGGGFVKRTSAFLPAICGQSTAYGNI